MDVAQMIIDPIIAIATPMPGPLGDGPAIGTVTGAVTGADTGAGTWLPRMVAAQAVTSSTNRQTM
jgi:hypothetical protein